MTFSLDSLNNTQTPITNTTVTKPIGITEPDSNIWDMLPAQKPSPTLPVDIIELGKVSTDSILDDKGINHLDTPKDQKPSATVKTEDGKTQKIYTNPDGSSTVVTGDTSALSQLMGGEYTIETFDKDGNKTKSTTSSGVCPKTESTKTYNEDGSVSSEVVTKTNPLTGEVETVIKEYLPDGSYVQTTTNKDGLGRESAGATYVYDKDGNKIDVNDMTEEQYNKALETKDEFDELGKFTEPKKEIPNPILMDNGDYQKELL